MYEDYCVRGGHNKGVPGASSQWMDEVNFDRQYSKELMNYLRQSNKKVVDGTPDRTSTKSEDLSHGVSIANDNKVKYFISCHVNSADSPQAHGCEVIYYPSSKEGKILAKRICIKLSELGFRIRSEGAKPDERGLYELKHTKMPAIIIEPFFLSSEEDTKLAHKLGAKRIAKAIAEGILNTKISEKSTTPSPYPLPLKMTKDCYAFTIVNNYPKTVKEFKANDLVTAKDSVNDYYMLDINGTRGYIPTRYTCKR